jgi:hypothetical protein
MLYLMPTFTCPVAGRKTSQQQWDLAFLNREEYKAKYGLGDEEAQKRIEQ